MSSVVITIYGHGGQISLLLISFLLVLFQLWGHVADEFAMQLLLRRED